MNEITGRLETASTQTKPACAGLKPINSVFFSISLTGIGFKISIRLPYHHQELKNV
jgi:hypothetical protein